MRELTAKTGVGQQRNTHLPKTTYQARAATLERLTENIEREPYLMKRFTLNMSNGSNKYWAKFTLCTV